MRIGSLPQRMLRPCLLAIAAALCVPLPSAAQGNADRPAASVAYAQSRGDMSIALTGDAIITRRLSVYHEPAFLRLRDVIRGATVGFTNLEILLHDFGPDIVPAAESGGTYMRADPAMARELAWMGFDLVSRANNHAMDYGVGGLRATTRAVRAAELVDAGVGENLALARAPGYLESPGGRVALISVASTFADLARAGPQRGDLRGRPGLSPLRYTTVYEVPDSALATLRGVGAALGLRRGGGRDTLVFAGWRFVRGAGYAVHTRPDSSDLAQIVAAVRDARRQADWVVVSSHSHEGAGSRDVPAEFVVALAHAVVDAGADVFVAHGPHVLRGVEIYRGRPIFYSLGNFIFENETVSLQPQDNYASVGLGDDALPADFYDRRNELSAGGFAADSAYWRSVVAVPVFRGGRLEEVRLRPITLGWGARRSQRGRPMLAPPAMAHRILARLQALSRSFGTTIEDRDGIGVIRVSAPGRAGGGPARPR